MALSIKDEETDRLVRRLARARKTSFTGAIRLAVSNELARGGPTPDERERFLQAVREAQEIVRRSPIDWSRSEDDILGYDENGIPTQSE